MVDDGRLAVGQAEVRQGVLVGDDLVGEVQEGEEEGYEETCSCFWGKGRRGG